MKKLRLDLEDLAVQTFATAPAARQKGTVNGRAEADATPRCPPTYTCPTDYDCPEPDTWTYCPPGCVTEVQTDILSQCFPDQC